MSLKDETTCGASIITAYQVLVKNFYRKIKRSSSLYLYVFIISNKKKKTHRAKHHTTRGRSKPVFVLSATPSQIVHCMHCILYRSALSLVAHFSLSRGFVAPPIRYLFFFFKIARLSSIFIPFLVVNYPTNIISLSFFSPSTLEKRVSCSRIRFHFIKITFFHSGWLKLSLKNFQVCKNSRWHNSIGNPKRKN